VNFNLRLAYASHFGYGMNRPCTVGDITARGLLQYSGMQRAGHWQAIRLISCQRQITSLPGAEDGNYL